MTDVDPILRTLFAVSETRDPAKPRPDQPFVGYLTTPSTMRLFRGEALAVYNELKRVLAQNALDAGGWSRDMIGQLLASACELADAETPEAAIALVHEFVDAERRSWLVAAESRDHFRGDDFQIGACTLRRTLPAEFSGDASPLAVEPPVITTVVHARDHESALIIAGDRFDEAAAILALAHQGRMSRVLPATMTASDGTVISSSAREGRVIAQAHIDSRGEWHPYGYRELSAAVARSESERTDWERRTIAAARWLHLASDAIWYTEALVNSIIALECLFIEPGRSRGKGRMIASRATAVSVLAGRDSRSQRKWIEQIYALRNDIAHEGSSTSRDLDVEDLLALVKRLVEWAVWHLTPENHYDGTACESITDVLRRHIDPLLAAERAAGQQRQNPAKTR